MKIALIIGHKKTSQGAMNEEMGISEFMFNEPFAHSLAEKLILEGHIPIVIYRSNYSSLPDKVNLTGADIAISLHCNAFNDNPNGTEMLFYRGSSKGRNLAKCLQKEVVKCLGLKDRGVKAISYEWRGKANDRGGYLLRNTKMPCVISEPFFIDSTSSLKLAQEKFEELGEAFVTGIKKYIEVYNG